LRLLGLFRFFEDFVDPSIAYQETDHPPQRLLPFLRAYARPYKKVCWITGIVSGMMQGKTVIAVTHLLSATDRITENRTLDALLAQDGQNATFWLRQSGGFLGKIQ